MDKQGRIELINSKHMVNNSFGVIDEVGISSLAAECEVSVVTIKKDLKEMGCIIYKRKNPKIKDLSEYEAIVEQLSLKIVKRMPRYAQKRSVREGIGKKNWDKVRTVMLEKYYRRCSVCGFKPEDTGMLEVHEQWEYDENKIVLKLVELSLLCTYCHSFQHLEHTAMLRIRRKTWGEDRHKLNIHFMKTNQCTQDVLQASLSLSAKKLQDAMFQEHDALMDMQPNEVAEYRKRKKQLETANWFYWIFEDMPLRDEVIVALKNKNKTVVND
ncbi:hypothetical protein CON03_20430 [Bacillus cereus]|nr:hypothetical protein CON03_20430 [Bacillus cereus]